MHILVLSRNPFSRMGCHRHIKSPTSGPHWAIMGIVVFFWVVLGFLGPGESVGGHFLRSLSPFVHMLEQRERRRSHRDCGPSVVVRDRTSSCRAQCRASYVDVRPCATGAHRPLLTCCSSFQAGFAASQMHLSISVSSLETSDLTLLQLTVLLRVQSISLQFSLSPFSATFLPPKRESNC